MNNTNEKKKSSLILKILKALLITLIVIALFVFGFYKLITYQWQDEPQTYDTTNQYIADLGDTMILAHRAGRRLYPCFP